MAALLDLADQLADLFVCSRSLRVRTGSGWMWVDASGSGLMCAPIRIQLAVADHDIAFLDLRAAGADAP